MKAIVSLVWTIFTLVSGEKDKQTRINCYPESESTYSNASKESCLARHCLYDDRATGDRIQCYLSPRYGYQLAHPVQHTERGLHLRLKRNAAVPSPFPQPIERVRLDVEYYTDAIIRLKFSDEDQQRYEVTKDLRPITPVPSPSALGPDCPFSSVQGTSFSTVSVQLLGG